MKCFVTEDSEWAQGGEYFSYAPPWWFQQESFRSILFANNSIFITIFSTEPEAANILNPLRMWTCMSHRFNPLYCFQIILNSRMSAGNKSVFHTSSVGEVDVIERSISQVCERFMRITIVLLPINGDYVIILKLYDYSHVLFCLVHSSPGHAAAAEVVCSTWWWW